MVYSIEEKGGITSCCYRSRDWAKAIDGIFNENHPE